MVCDAAAEALNNLLSIIPPEAITTHLFPILFTYLSRSSTRWQSKVAALQVFVVLSKSHPKIISSRLVDIIPHLTDAIHDTKAQVCEAAKKAASAACATVDNQDIIKFIPVLVECMANPNDVSEGIKKLSSTTFVAEVTGPASGYYCASSRPGAQRTVTGDVEANLYCSGQPMPTHSGSH